MPDMEKMLRVGVITASHGLAGDVTVFPTTDDPKRFRDLQEVYAAVPEGLKPLRVVKARFFKKYVIVHFEGYDRIEQIQEFVKCDLLVDRAHALPLREGQYYLADLIGLKVVQEDGSLLGTLEEVLQTGANDVYAVKKAADGRELLIPAIPQCIRKIDLEQGTVTVFLLPGLE